ncbi:hypothetical protein OZX72_07880 [Bifidobacterium sp. ESL0769]|uniref:hypothetical protein n=1 Tax=Bifidobacterium sp. ESL0769 TaxID=2983229 RepID=UPI0023F8913F|nr:hypothetical protein [Bifidobacterium sp. ESL0769]WEV67148.1 hypothetical protein OZX72_07880 [Bifidobacterium sp. ESL0769]
MGSVRKRFDSLTFFMNSMPKCLLIVIITINRRIGLESKRKATRPGIRQRKSRAQTGNIGQADNVENTTGT